MADPYPENLAFEVDRPRLRKYLQSLWLIAWLLAPCIYGLAIGAASGTGRIPADDESLLLNVAVRTIAGLVIGLAIGGSCFLMFSHRTARRISETLELSVEGPFLRLRQHGMTLSDRKIHFNAIVDYSVSQNPLMRFFGVHELQMTTLSGGRAGTIKVPGVVDCFAVRDQLSEIDRTREKS
jgi:hypothetical protein